MIQSIESTKDNFIKFSKESKRLRTEIEKPKEELTELIERFDTFEISENKFKEIRQSLTVLNGGLTRKLGEYKDSIIGKKQFTFKFDDIQIKNLFGFLEEFKNVNS
jgi:hypothetical protein